MSNFFSRLNRKEKRKFQSLPDEEKADIISAEINKKVRETINREVGVSFLDGYLYASKILKERYIDKQVSSKEEYDEVIFNMIQEIKSNVEKYDKRHTFNEENKESEDK